MWRGGCIIRSRFLGKIKEAYDKNPNLNNLLLDDFFSQALNGYQDSWRRAVIQAIEYGVPTPAFSTALAFYDGYRTARLPANLLQAQRDFFGAHTYERVDQAARPVLPHQLDRPRRPRVLRHLQRCMVVKAWCMRTYGHLRSIMNYGFESASTARSTFSRWARWSIGSTRASSPSARPRSADIHVSGGEFNCAANLSDCFGLHTGIASAMVDYPIGDLIAERVRAMGVKPFYKHFKHDGVTGPNMATVYSDRGYGVRAPVVFYNRANEAAALLKPGDFDWKAIFGAGVRWFHSGGIFAALSPTTAELIIEGMQAAKAAGAVVSFDSELPRETVEHLGRPRARRGGDRPHRRERRCAGGQRGGPANGPGHSRPGSGRQIQARPQRLLRHDRPRGGATSANQNRGHHPARSALDQPP